MGIRAGSVALIVRVVSLLSRASSVRVRALPPLAVGLGLASAAVILPGTQAAGKSSYDSAYGFDRTWNAALRLVRVNLGLKVLEKDEKSGYILFEYRASETQKVSSNGSFELIRGSSSTRVDEVRVVAQLPQMPAYHEQVLLDELARKMRAEYGEAPEPRPPVTPAADAGPDGNEESY